MSSGQAKIGKPAPAFKCQALDNGVFKVSFSLLILKKEKNRLTHSVAVLDIVQRGGTSLGGLSISVLLELS